MLQNNLKLLMVKNHKTIKQVSQETGIKKGSLEMYVLGRDIMGDDLTILARYFKTNTIYLSGIWDIAADEKHLSHFRKLFKDKSIYQILVIFSRIWITVSIIFGYRLYNLQF